MNAASHAEEQVPRLTRREAEVLQLLSMGLHNREIASALMISAHTADSHTRRVFRKLGVRSRLHSTQQAQRFGLLGAAPAQGDPLGGLISSLSLVVMYGEMCLSQQHLPRALATTGGASHRARAAVGAELRLSATDRRR